MDRRRFLAAAAAPLVLGAAPAAWGRSLGGGTPLALVTADLEAAVVAVELETGRAHGRLETPGDPRSIETVGDGRALVAHTGRGEVTVIEARTWFVGEVSGAFGAPRYTAAHPAGRFAYVTDSERAEVAVVDVLRRRVVGRAAVGGPARHLSIDRSGRRLWVALGTKARSIAILDLSRPTSPRVVGGLRPPFLAHDVGFTPGGRRVWVTSGDRGRIAIYEARNGLLVRTLAGDAPPQHVTFLGERAYVTSGDDGLLRVHALDGRLLRSTSVPPGSFNVQQGGGYVLTPSLTRGTICVVTSGGVPIRELRVARSSHDACFVQRR
jgi:DNA-binding beta-propeller fold protein YncE